MAKVIYTLPNASDCINGIAFEKHELGMVSEDISDEVAAVFVGIKGYVLHKESNSPSVPAPRGRRGKAQAQGGGDDTDQGGADSGDVQGENTGA